MTTHVMHFVDETESTVRWRCGVCQRETNFAKEGYGEPHADQFTFPENIDAYLDICPGTYVGVMRNVTRGEFLDRFATEELGAMDLSQDLRVRGMLFRMQNDDQINLNEPRWEDDLRYAEGQGILTPGRAAIILQQ